MAFKYRTLYGDADQNGVVNDIDIYVVSKQIGQTAEYGRSYADVNRTGRVDVHDYMAIDQHRWGGGEEDVDFRYTGHYYHAKSGLYLAPFRIYNPVSGRWISRDPFHEEGGFNLYQYAAGNPANLVDILGLSPYLPDPDMKPPGWEPSWPTGNDNRGDFSKNPNTGEKWYPHKEDKNHWPHYDSDQDPNKRYPKKCLKPKPNQKKPPYGDQSQNNPWPKKPSTPKTPWWQRIPIPLRRFPLLLIPPPEIWMPPSRSDSDQYA